jgi:hypothetical protein
MNAAATVRDSLPSRVDAMRIAVLCGVGVLGTIGLLFVMRRAAGAFTTELGVAPLAATLLLAAIVVFGGRIVWRRRNANDSGRVEQRLGWVGTGALLLVCFGAAWPSSQSFAWLMWLPLVGADWYSRMQLLRRTQGASVRALESSGIPPLTPAVKGGGPEESIVQEVVRARDARGVESVRGTLRADFVAGQRHATLYVGFCPPLERLPEIEAEVAEGPDAAIKVVQAFAHGARLDLRLGEEAEEACSVIVELVAVPAARTLL